MSKSHNKRRNVGLLYEFLVQTISRALVDNDPKTSAKALKIVKKYFKPGSEIYKEFRLMSALVKTTVSNEAVAASIVQEAKLAARSHDMKELDRQKSLLISTINRSLNDENFYDQQVNEYRIFATVQTLLNDWRSADRDIGRIATYEDQLVQWLVSEKSEPSGDFVPADNPGTGRLMMKIMMKKLNEKYASTLSHEQKQLIRAYAFSTASDDPQSIKKKLIEVKDRLLHEIAKFSVNNSDSEYVSSKLAEARERLEEETLDVIDDSVVARFMLYTKLSSELTGE